MVKQGTLVRVDGKQASVETSWGQGVHRVFKLSDGRQIFDLDKLVADGRAKVESIPDVDPNVVPMPVVKEPKKWSV